MKIVKTASGESIKISKTEWETIGNKTGWLKEAQAESNPLNGRSKQSAKNFIYRLVGDMTKGFFKDDAWEGVHAIFDKMRDSGIEVNMTDAQYHKDEQGLPSDKTWKFEIPFMGKNDKPQVLYGVLVASFAGTVQDVMGRYDLSLMV